MKTGPLSFFTLLSPDERSRAQRFSCDDARDCYITGRGLLRRILGKYLCLPPERIEFEYTINGKPSLRHSHDCPDIRFNISHSNGLMLIGIAGGTEIGVDIEKIDPAFDTANIRAGFFTEHEKIWFHGLAEEQRQEAFFRWWVEKEAVGKLSGRGIETVLTNRRDCGKLITDEIFVFQERVGEYIIGFAVEKNLSAAEYIKDAASYPAFTSDFHVILLNM